MTDDKKPPYEKPEATPLGGDGPLTDDEAGIAVGGGSGAADCYSGAVAYSSGCETGTYAQP